MPVLARRCQKCETNKAATNNGIEGDAVELLSASQERTSKRTSGARVAFESIVFRFRMSQFSSNDGPTAMTTATTHATLFIFANRFFRRV